MDVERLQCPVCGYLLDWGATRCPVCHPFSEMPDHIKAEWANAHLRGLILDFGRGDAVVREASLWEEHVFPEQDVRLLLGRMEDDQEIERFAGYYRVVRHNEGSA